MPRRLSQLLTPLLVMGLTLGGCSGGSGTAPVELALDTLPPCAAASDGALCILEDLGHVCALGELRRTPTRVLSRDCTGRWILRDVNTQTVVAAGQSSGPADLAGDLVALADGAVIIVRSAADGRPLVRIDAGDTAGLAIAPQGAYLWTATARGVAVWSANGSPLLRKTGDYSHAKFSATPTGLYIGGGPAAESRIETLSIPAGTSSLSERYLGNFHSFFADGERFLTTLETSLRVYSKAASQEALFAFDTDVGRLEGLRGYGRYVWHAVGFHLRVLAVDGGMAPVAEYDFNGPLLSSGASLALISGASHAKLVSFATSPPGVSEVDLGDLSAPTVYAAAVDGRWAFGNADGVLRVQDTSAGGATRVGLGQLRAMAGSATGTLAIATNVGGIRLYNLDAPGLPRTGSISAQVRGLALSSAGTVLAAIVSDIGTHVYSLPSQTVTSTFPAQTPGSYPKVYASTLGLSGDGVRLVQNGVPYGPHANHSMSTVTNLQSGLVELSVLTDGVTLLMSPSGRRVAYGSGATPNATSHLLVDGVVNAIVAGEAIGWLDEDRLLAKTYRPDATGNSIYAGARIFSIAGEAFPAPPLPDLARLDTSSPARLYAPAENRVYEATTGALLWSPPAGIPRRAQDLGTIAGSCVVFTSGTRLLAACPFE